MPQPPNLEHQYEKTQDIFNRTWDKTPIHGSLGDIYKISRNPPLNTPIISLAILRQLNEEFSKDAKLP